MNPDDTKPMQLRRADDRKRTDLQDNNAQPTQEQIPTAAMNKTIESWQKDFDTPKWLFAGAKALRQWPIGKEVSEEEYRSALDEFANLPIR